MESEEKVDGIDCLIIRVARLTNLCVEITRKSKYIICSSEGLPTTRRNAL